MHLSYLFSFLRDFLSWNIYFRPRILHNIVELLAFQISSVLQYYSQSYYIDLWELPFQWFHINCYDLSSLCSYSNINCIHTYCTFIMLCCLLIKYYNDNFFIFLEFFFILYFDHNLHRQCIQHVLSLCLCWYCWWWKIWKLRIAHSEEGKIQQNHANLWQWSKRTIFV